MKKQRTEACLSQNPDGELEGILCQGGGRVGKFYLPKATSVNKVEEGKKTNKYK